MLDCLYTLCNCFKSKRTEVRFAAGIMCSFLLLSFVFAETLSHVPYHFSWTFKLTSHPHPPVSSPDDWPSFSECWRSPLLQTTAWEVRRHCRRLDVQQRVLDWLRNGCRQGKLLTLNKLISCYFIWASTAVLADVKLDCKEVRHTKSSCCFAPLPGLWFHYPVLFV